MNVIYYDFYSTVFENLAAKKHGEEYEITDDLFQAIYLKFTETQKWKTAAGVIFVLLRLIEHHFQNIRKLKNIWKM